MDAQLKNAITFLCRVAYSCLKLVQFLKFENIVRLSARTRLGFARCFDFECAYQAHRLRHAGKKLNPLRGAGRQLLDRRDRDDGRRGH